MSKKIKLQWISKTGQKIVTLPIKVFYAALDESKSVGKKIKRMIK